MKKNKDVSDKQKRGLAEAAKKADVPDPDSEREGFWDKVQKELDDHERKTSPEVKKRG